MSRGKDTIELYLRDIEEIPLLTREEEVALAKRAARGDDKARQQLVRLSAEGWDHLPICVAKTPLSISHDPALKGVPTDFEVPIDEVRLCAGAGFVYALAGPIMTMPGLGSLPAYRHIDIDDDGRLSGLF